MAGAIYIIIENSIQQFIVLAHLVEHWLFNPNVPGSSPGFDKTAIRYALIA